jgi:Rha family phage regulatory protein
MTSVVPRLPQPRLVVRQQQVHTTSLAMAEFFEKNHFHVMRDIEALITDCHAGISLLNSEERDLASDGISPSNFGCRDSAADGISTSKIEPTLRDVPAFVAANFSANAYVDSRGKTQSMYLLTKDGFVLLAMGFTGQKALSWKIRYIEAFNAMAQTLAGAAVEPASAEAAVVRTALVSGLPGVAELLPLCGGYRAPAQVLDVLLRHGAHQTPVSLSYREIVRATGSQVSVSGVHFALKTLARFGYVEQVPVGTGRIRVLAALFERLAVARPVPAIAVATGLRQ